MTINTAEIEARPVFEFDRYVDGKLRAEGIKISGQNDLVGAIREASRLADAGDVLVLRSEALKAETARADKAENGLLDEAERSADLQSQLTAANEKLAAYAKAEKDAAELYDWVMSVCENPPEPTPALRAVWEKYKDLPAFSTGDGNGR